MKLLPLVTTFALSWVSSHAFTLDIGTRNPGDKLLYSFRLEAGPFETARDIELSFTYNTADLIFGREYLTQISFSRPDDLYPNHFRTSFLNSTFLHMTPVRVAMTEWWVQGDLYGFDEEPFPTD